MENKYQCMVCGYIHEGEQPPDTCPVCGVDRDGFEALEQQIATKEIKGYRCINCGYFDEKQPDLCPVCGVTHDQFQIVYEEEASVHSDFRGHVVILGGGVAGITAATELRRLSENAQITVISGEETLPYYRLNLTRFLSDDLSLTDMKLYDQYWYDEQRIRLFTHQVAVDIDRTGRSIHCFDGTVIKYDYLIIAMGAHAFVPPIEGSHLPRVSSFRYLSEAMLLKEMSQRNEKLLVLGGGVLGLEIAGAMAKQKTKVVILESSDHLMPRQLDSEGGAVLENILKNMGIEVSYGVRTKGIEETYESAILSAEDGRVFEGDRIVLATGVRSNTYLARKSELTVHQGIVVDDFMRTSDPLIYAVGDVCEHYGQTYGLWQIAVMQGRTAAHHICGSIEPFGAVPRANTLKVLDVALFSIGEINALDGSYRQYRKLTDETYIKFIVKDQCISGAICIGHEKVAMKLKFIVEKQLQMPSHLAGIDDIIGWVLEQ